MTASSLTRAGAPATDAAMVGDPATSAPEPWVHVPAASARLRAALENLQFAQRRAAHAAAHELTALVRASYPTAAAVRFYWDDVEGVSLGGVAVLACRGSVWRTWPDLEDLADETVVAARAYAVRRGENPTWPRFSNLDLALALRDAGRNGPAGDVLGVLEPAPAAPVLHGPAWEALTGYWQLLGYPVGDEREVPLG